MIKVNKVDSLKKEQKEMTYGDLKPNQAFIFTSAPSANVRIRTDQGHYNPKDGTHYIHPGPCTDKNNPVIPVDAEINWCYKGASQ